MVDLDQLTPYERKAWDTSVRVLTSATRRWVPASVAKRTTQAKNAVGSRMQDIPGSESVQGIVTRTLDGTLSLTFRPALRTASADSVLKAYDRGGIPQSTMADVRAVQLEDRDRMQPRKRWYTGAAAGQGAATAVAVTGSEVSATVTGGVTAGVVVAAVAVDAVSSLALMGRVVGDVASRYGYDVSDPSEELFAMGVLSLGMAGDVGAKTQALAALSRLTQRMMRQATWKELNKHVLVKVLQTVYGRLGLRLTQRKLAQIVPVAGIAINSALTASLVDKTFERAQAVYRLRAISEKYDIDPDAWLQGVPGASEATDEVILDMEDVLEGELLKELPERRDRGDALPAT